MIVQEHAMRKITKKKRKKRMIKNIHMNFFSCFSTINVNLKGEKTM